MKSQGNQPSQPSQPSQLSQKRQIIPPHQPPADAAAYLAAVSDEERRLVSLAIERLGSSYFMEKSHGYLAWKAKNNASSHT